jgi:3D (Asp-Asp-Asp) domain-containing protein/acid phosphatase family membrane protein YuiD
MATRSLNVVITGDTKGLDRATRDAGRSIERLGKETSLHARVTSRGFSGMALAARGMTAGFGAAAFGASKLIGAFEESRKVSAQTAAVLKSTGGAANVSARQVSALATALSQKTGIDDEAIQSGENLLLTFTRVRNEAGRGNNVFTRATRIITDMSAALGQDLNSSAIQVGKALNDPIRGITALRRVGVSFTASQQHQIKVLEDTGHHMQAQRIILRELNKEFAGVAAAKASPFDKLKVSAGNLAEMLGGRLAPTVGKAANSINKFLIQMDTGRGAGGRFAATMGRVSRQVSDVDDAARPVVRTVGQVTGAITRNRIAVNLLLSPLKNLAGQLRGIKAIFDGIKSAAGAVAGALGAVGNAAKKIPDLNPFGDGIGQALGFMGSTGGKGSLMGADADLMPFASIAARMGLHTTSGLRPGSITASGNVSYHSSGDAIDESGSPSAMLRYFRFLRANFGSRLRELIHTPGGVGIKDGRPYRYTGQVARDHYDHVHVAFTGPFGDGPGKKRGDGRGRFTATSYGPPWGGIQGTGVTATGVNLRGAPHRSGIAVDPRVIPLGSRVKVHPNPFGYDGYFTAFDTGGAIKGHHIDFYDWRGRAAQNGWGARTVRISTGGGGGGSRHGGGGGGGGSSRSRNAYVQGMTGEGTTPNMELGSGRVRVGGNRDVTFEGTPLSGPGQGGYEQHVADAGLREATARSGNNLAGVIKALQDELKLKVRRLKTVRKALARRLRPDTRKTLTDEATTLVGEIADLRGTLKEYRADRRGGATTVTQAEGLEAGVDPNAPGPVTPEDILGSQAARASLTPGLDDDLAVAMQQENRAWQIMQAQLADRDPRNDAEAISNYQAAAANRQSFQDTIKDNTDALKEHTDALQAVGDQQKRANDLAAQMGASGEFQVTKYLAEIMSGQFGRGIVGRSFTPGSGAVAAY